MLRMAEEGGWSNARRILNSLIGSLVEFAAMTPFTSSLAEHEYFSDDEARSSRAGRLVLTWLALAVGLLVVTMAVGSLLLDVAGVGDEPSSSADFVLCAMGWILFWIALLYGPKLTLAVPIRRRSRR